MAGFKAGTSGILTWIIWGTLVTTVWATMGYYRTYTPYGTVWPRDDCQIIYILWIIIKIIWISFINQKMKEINSKDLRKNNPVVLLRKLITHGMVHEKSGYHHVCVNAMTKSLDNVLIPIVVQMSHNFRFDEMEIKWRNGKTLIEPFLYRVTTLSVLYKHTVDLDPKVPTGNGM